MSQKNNGEPESGLFCSSAAVMEGGQSECVGQSECTSECTEGWPDGVSNIQCTDALAPRYGRQSDTYAANDRCQAGQCDTAETRLEGETKYNVYKGWLIPYMVAGDMAFNNSRWLWWLECLSKGEIPKGPLPQIKFELYPNERVAGVKKHIMEAITHIGRSIGMWKALDLFMDWLLWGMGDTSTQYPDIDEDIHNWLYKNFQLGRLQQYPHDYLGSVISEQKGSGWNPTAFYPTPESVVEAMVLVNGLDQDENAPFVTVMDPALGTARFLTHASNYSIFLYGMDIDPTVIKASKINLNLYAPWGALPAKYLPEPPYYEISENLKTCALARLYYSQVGMEQLELQALEKKYSEVGNVFKSARAGKKSDFHKSGSATVSATVGVDNPEEQSDVCVGVGVGEVQSVVVEQPAEQIQGCHDEAGVNEESGDNKKADEAAKGQLSFLLS